MLRELSVRALGVIDEIVLDLGPGMTALTGETGAGKTLVVEALQLLVGGRADPGLVRPGCDAALVEGRFEGVGSGDPAGGDEMILAREVPAQGRSRAWCNGRMATAASLAETGSELLDLHGQHDHMTLMTPQGQRCALDSYAGVDPAPLRAARSELAGVADRIAALGGDPDERQREADFLRYQIDELRRACIDDPAEEEALAMREELLAAADAHRESAQRALLSLGTGSAGTDPGLGISTSASDSIASAIAALAGHRPFDHLDERLRALADGLADVGHDLRVAYEAIEDDPEQLGQVRARRQLLFDLARKYGGSLDAARSYLASAGERLESLERDHGSAAELQIRLESARAAVAAAEASIRHQRARAAPLMAAAITEKLRTLAMPKATVEVAVGKTGAGDEVTFLLGANPGEPLLPLSRVASGGELARTTLAVRLVCSGGPSTLVFDEVDAGVGGEAALAVGRALAALAARHQVVVVTHLAQVAALADRQVAVSKSLVEGRTVAEVHALDGEQRVLEISRMLSGQPESPAARSHAEELLRAAAAIRDQLSQR